MAFNPQFQNLITNEILKSLGKKKGDNVSRYKLAKESLRLQKTMMAALRDFVLIAAGIFSAAFGLRSFLIPNHLIDGGVTGISLLVSRETGISLSVFLLLFNLPFVLLGWNQISKIFSIKGMLAISGLTLLVAFFPFQKVTSDTTLVAVFGGFFIGAGIGLCIRGGAVIDGTEILAIFISRKRFLTIGDIILLVNIIIFSVAAWLLSLETALYSMLTYMAASKTADYVLDGIEEYMQVTIISPHQQEIAEFIKNEMGRGLTIYTGKKGYGKQGDTSQPREILFTVITRLEVNRLNTAIEKIDPHAFVVMHRIRDTRGGMVKKRRFH